MLQRTTAIDLPPVPGPPLRVIIEDPALIVDDLATPSAAIEVPVGRGDSHCVGTCRQAGPGWWQPTRKRGAGWAPHGLMVVG
jgi:hypothetical protein